MTPPLNIDLLRRIVVVGFNCLALAAPAVADGKRIATEDEFQAHVVDRTLTRDRTVLRYAGNGSLSGVVRGARLDGTWVWAGATLCRRATLGSRSLGYDCMAVFVIRDLVILVRNAGRGRAFALRFRGAAGRPGDAGDTEEFILACCT